MKEILVTGTFSFEPTSSMVRQEQRDGWIIIEYGDGVVLEVLTEAELTRLRCNRSLWFQLSKGGKARITVEGGPNPPPGPSCPSDRTIVDM
jgi:hypothetical protein